MVAKCNFFINFYDLYEEMFVHATLQLPKLTHKHRKRPLQTMHISDWCITSYSPALFNTYSLYNKGFKYLANDKLKQNDKYLKLFAGIKDLTLILPLRHINQTEQSQVVLIMENIVLK